MSDDINHKPQHELFEPMKAAYMAAGREAAGAIVAERGGRAGTGADQSRSKSRTLRLAGKTS